MRRPWLAGAGVAAAVSAWPASGEAVNGLRPRVATEFADVPCLVRVDRLQARTFHIDYAIAMEDLELDATDVASGRTHQFLALRRRVDGLLPAWITWDDVEEAAASGLVITDALDDNDVFETSTDWPTGSWLRITPDVPRIPISFEAAMSGVDWDTTAVPLGPWQVMGYTWDPEINLTTVRDGLVMVVEGDDPSAYPPGAHVRIGPESSMVWEGDELVLEGCIDAMAGTKIEVAWAETAWNGTADWQPVDADVRGPNDRGELEIRARVPFDMGGNPAPSYRVRVTVEDPLGREHVAWTANTFVVLENGEPVPADEPIDGCGCTTGGTSPWSWWLGSVLLVTVRSTLRRSHRT